MPELIEIKEAGGKTFKAYYDPNYKSKCCVCGSNPCVRIRYENGKVYYDNDMCGACTWGEADCIDPENW